MEKIGFVRSAENDFEHPSVAPDDPLRPHVLYTRSRIDWSCRRDERLRPARRGDRRGLESLRRAVYADLFDVTFGGWDEARHARHERACWEQGGISILEENGERIGMIQLSTATGSIEVCEIQIRPVDQGRGLGRAILEKIQSEAMRDDRAVDLSVPRHNTSAQRLYALLGFVPNGQSESHSHLRWVGGAVSRATR